MQRAVTEVSGHRQALDHHRDRLGGAHRARRGLELDPPVLALPGAQLAEHRDDATDLVGGRGDVGQRQGPGQRSDALGDDADLFLDRRRRGEHDRVEPPAERAGQLVHAPVATVRRGNQVEAGPGLHLTGQLGDRQHLLAEHGDERVLHITRHARQLLDAHDGTLLHRPVHGRRHERAHTRPLGQQAGVVPAVANRLLRCAGGALHQHRRVATDGRRKMLADPCLGGTGQAEQEQGTVGGERRDGDLDQATRADVLRRDDGAVGQATAHQVGDDRPRRQPPARRPRAIVLGDQRRELRCVLDLGVRAQDVDGVVRRSTQHGGVVECRVASGHGSEATRGV